HMAISRALSLANHVDTMIVGRSHQPALHLEHLDFVKMIPKFDEYFLSRILRVCLVAQRVVGVAEHTILVIEHAFLISRFPEHWNPDWLLNGDVITNGDVSKGIQIFNPVEVRIPFDSKTP